MCENTRHAHTKDMEGAEAQVFPSEVLRAFSTRVFLHFGVNEQDAAEAADVLVCADLRGIDSHSVARLHTYFELHNERRLNPRPATQKSTSQLPTIRSEAISSEGTSTLLPSFRPFRNSQNHQSCGENCEHHKP